MSLKLHTGVAAHPFVVRFFIQARKGLTIQVINLDIPNLENRRLAFRAISPRAEVPALELPNGTIITETPAICEYLDEIASGGTSLFGSNAVERAETRMWLRRMDLEIAQPLIAWWRNHPEMVDFYQGNRTPVPEAKTAAKVAVNQGLNRLEDELEGRTWLCGNRFSAADVHFYGLIRPMVAGGATWVEAPGRRNVMAYLKRLDERAKSVGTDFMIPFEGTISL